VNGASSYAGRRSGCRRIARRSSGDSWPCFARLEVATNGTRRKVSSELPVACKYSLNGHSDEFGQRVEAEQALLVFTEFKMPANFKGEWKSSWNLVGEKTGCVDYFLFIER
jgi:hypothetical protein